MKIVTLTDAQHRVISDIMAIELAEADELDEIDRATIENALEALEQAKEG